MCRIIITQQSASVAHSELTHSASRNSSQLTGTLLPAAKPSTHQTFINQMTKAVALVVVDEIRRKEPLVVIILTRNLRRVPLLAFCSFHVIKNEDEFLIFFSCECAMLRRDHRPSGVQKRL